MGDSGATLPCAVRTFRTRGGITARYYDPATGQFLTVDPDVVTTLSPYGYVADDPLNATDPTGLCVWIGCNVLSFLNQNGFCTNGQSNCETGAQAVSNAISDVDPNLVYNLTDPHPSGVVAFVRNASVLVSLGTDVGNELAGRSVPASDWVFDVLGFVPFDSVAAKGAEWLADSGLIPAGVRAWNLSLDLQGAVQKLTIGSLLDALGLRLATATPSTGASGAGCKS